MKLGLLDIGSNSIHLILVDIKKDLSVEVLDRAKEFTRLGHNTFINGKLSLEGMQRGIATIRRFRKLSDIREVSKIKAVATSAVREAKNNGDFIDLIQKETGIKVAVITGEEEARLIYLAVKHLVPIKEPVLIIDIGGGSVELIIANEKGLIDCTSLKLGTLRVRDEFLKNDPPTAKEIDKVNRAVNKAVSDFFEKNRKHKISTIIGTSGTIMNLVTMAHWQTGALPIESPNNYKIRAQEVLKLHDQIIGTDSRARLKIKGLDPQRNEIITSGSLVFTSLVKKWAATEIMLCDGALREGLVYDYLEKNKSKIELESLTNDIRLRSVMVLFRKYDFKPQHAQHVVTLALSLFDQTHQLHKLTAAERELLQYAALLHDVGYHISYNKHQKHTYYLIKNGVLNGFQSREIDIIANVARYHTRSTPKKKHGNLTGVSSKDQHIIYCLAAILRIADALDRSHFGVVTSLNTTLKGNACKINIFAKSDPELEIWAADKRKDLFEEIFGKKITFIHKAKKGKS